MSVHAIIFAALKTQKCSVAKIAATLLALGCICYTARADADDQPTTNSWDPQHPRFGLLGGLDHRSGYFQDAFPQPLLVEDTSLEETEFELNYFHTAAGQQRSDIASAELQKSFGVLTFELEVPYQRTSDSDDTARGIGNIEVSARSPIYQYVASGGCFDNTLGVGMGVGIPTYSQVSKYTELEPFVFNDLALGKHFTIQTVLGYDTLVGSGEDGGSEDFEYGLVFACTIPHAEWPLPGIARISPMFEISSELGLNKSEAGQNSMLGSIGLRLDFQNIGESQPSLGLGFVFPMTNAARDEVHWGIVSNFIFEF